MVDSLSLCKMHGSHVDLCIADQTVKTYIGFVAGEAAPYPPPSDPLLATPILAVSSSLGQGHPVWRISSSLALGHYLRFGFGPIIRLQLRLEPLFLPVSAERFCMAALPICPIVRGTPPSDSPLDQFSGSRGAAPPRSAASADGPWALPIPSGGAFLFSTGSFLPLARQVLPRQRPSTFPVN